MKKFTLLNKEQHSQFIETLHDKYLDRINKYYGISGKDLSRFSWTENKHVDLFIMKTYQDMYTFPTNYYIVFSRPSESDRLLYIDLVEETRVPSFGKLTGNPLESISWIVSNNLIEKNELENINSSSLAFEFVLQKNVVFDSELGDSFSDWAYKWVDSEYNSTQKKLSQPTTIETFPTTNKRFFIDRYHFDEMLKVLNNEQFTDEFNQCLFAYEHEKWFLCCAGLGSCLEHLMFIILKNYSNNGFNTLQNLSKNPTANDYIANFRKAPINISSRQEIFFKMLFMARNAVDHHNTGKTQKGMCDLLLDGISDTYNDYYSNSINSEPI
ncbi:hypothetical protein [Ligilactobacillus animalis]